MTDLVIFGGTTEGRQMAEVFMDSGISICVCAATDYAGELLWQTNSNINVHVGRMNKEEMEGFIRIQGCPVVVDATHPYAQEASVNIREACRAAGCCYIRVIRDKGELSEHKPGGKCVWVPDISAAAEYLKNTKGNILVTTGSKDLDKYRAIPDFENRCYVRILPDGDALKECKRMGFAGSHIICMQGPFTEEMNRALLRQVKAEYMVTKEAGRAGGYKEKLEAAQNAGAAALIVGRPREDWGYSFSQAVEKVKKQFKLTGRPFVKLVGMGMGGPESLTAGALNWLLECQVIIGSKRLLNGLNSLLSEGRKDSFSCCEKEQIRDFIKSHPEYEKIAVVFSGDTGFYSGAKGLCELLDFCRTEVISGISSPVYFLNKLKVPGEDVKLLSAHGKQVNLIHYVNTNKQVFTLLGGKWDVKWLLKELLEYGMYDVRVTVGEQLSSPLERIISGSPGQLVNEEFHSLSVAFIENPEAMEQAAAAIRDEEFIRGRIPMTKWEIRSLCIRKLGLKRNSVLYDIGAGTGSVSVEAARLCPDGRVYAIEKNPEGIRLIRENKRKFRTGNIEIIKGEAPFVLAGLEPPTHAFIGGSQGALRDIMTCLLKVNPDMRIVLTAVTLETIGEIERLLKELFIPDWEIVQAVISRSREMKGYHMMIGENPVYIITLGGNGDFHGKKDAESGNSRP